MAVGGMRDLLTTQTRITTRFGAAEQLCCPVTSKSENAIQRIVTDRRLYLGLEVVPN